MNILTEHGKKCRFDNQNKGERMETRFSILFYGKKAKMTKDGLVPIYLRVTIGGERFETSIPQ